MSDEPKKKSIFGEDTFVAENGKVKWYKNSWTKSAEEWAAGWGLKGIRCLIAEQKSTGERDYVLIQGNEFIYESKQYEAIGVHIDIMAAHDGLKRGDRF